MNDPRERIETEHFQCRLDIGDAPDAWEIGGTNFTGESGYADWPEVVEFARAILAADESWLDSRTPTLEELRAKYPDAYPGIAPKHCANDCFEAWSRLNPRRDFVSRGEALRWLAAKLEEITPVETEQQFRECPACDGRGGIARQVSEDEWYHSPCEVCEGRREVPVEELT